MSQNLNIANGTKTATAGGTEDTLDTESSAGVFTLTVNLKNMVNGDIVVLRAYQKVLTGDGQQWLCYSATFPNKAGDAAAVGSNAQGDVVTVSPPIVSGAASLVFTLTQTAGSARDFPWRVDQLS